MKKIVGILCAAAMAASVFAADVAARARFEGSLFNVNKDGDVSAFRLYDGDKDWFQSLSFATWGEKAGATFGFNDVNYYSWNGTYPQQAETKVRMMLYFNPFVEGLQVKLGYIESNLHIEHIDWSKSINNKAAGNGFTVMYTHSSFGIEMYLNSGIDSDWSGLGQWYASKTAKELWMKTWYGMGDAGAIGATFYASENFKKYDISVGYDNNFNGVGLFADAAVTIADELTGLAFDADVSGAIDAFGYEAYVQYTRDMTADKNADAVYFKGKATYALDACTAYVWVEENNFLADNFVIEVKPGLNGNFGGMNWDLAADFKVGKDTFDMSIPFVAEVCF